MQSMPRVDSRLGNIKEAKRIFDSELDFTRALDFLSSYHGTQLVQRFSAYRGQFRNVLEL